MRLVHLSALALASALVLSACARPEEAEVERAIDSSVGAIDDNGLSDVMLTAADPEEAVAYFRRTSAAAPGRVDLKRGLATSLIRAGRAREGAAAWAEVVGSDAVRRSDRVAYADALIRNGEWSRADAALDAIPPTYESAERYRLEAMVADSHSAWGRADSFYRRAVARTDEPAGVLNNWGYSKLTRGAYAEAERLFAEALAEDPDLFTAKNNLVLARAGQSNYQLPVLETTEEERARLLHTMALSAIRQGDVNMGESLLEDAIATHPQYFEAAARSLRALRNDDPGA